MRIKFLSISFLVVLLSFLSMLKAEAFFFPTCSPNLSASCLGSTEVFWFCPQFRLIKFPSPTACSISLGPNVFSTVTAVMVLWILAGGFFCSGIMWRQEHKQLHAAAESADGVEFTAVIFLLEEQRNAELPFQIFPWFSRLLMVL